MCWKSIGSLIQTMFFSSVLSIIKLNFYICFPDSLVYVSTQGDCIHKSDSYPQTLTDIEKHQLMQEE